MGLSETADTLRVSAAWRHVCEKAESSQEYDGSITCMPLFLTHVWCMYQPNSANFSKKTVTVPRVAFAHCKPTSWYRDPSANLLIHSIHDLSAVQSSHPEQESPPSDGSAGSPLSPHGRRSSFDEGHERNIYPITWRVIGGGVMMGGQST